DPFHLKNDLAGTHDGHPVIGRALALAHTGFSRLLGHGLVGEQAQPHLAAALDETRHGDARRLDLAVGDVARLQDLQAVVAEGQRRAAPRLATAAPALLLAVLNFFRHQHKTVLSSWLPVSRCRTRTAHPAKSEPKTRRPRWLPAARAFFAPEFRRGRSSTSRRSRHRSSWP